jgi:hypothetical protein
MGSILVTLRMNEIRQSIANREIALWPAYFMVVSGARKVEASLLGRFVRLSPDRAGATSCKMYYATIPLLRR